MLSILKQPQTANMPTDDLTFSSLLCSRLCHDLVSPVGAVANGIELMEMEDDPAMAEDALDLLRHSAENATRKLKFLRLAFGSSGGDGTPLDIGATRKATADYFADARLNLVWPVSEEGGIPKQRVRLALNLILTASMGLARGGDLGVDLGGSDLTITGTHERAGLGDEVVEALTGRREASDGEDARIIEAFLAHKIATAEGLELKVRQDIGRFTITI